MGIERRVWVGTVLLVAAAACSSSSGDDTTPHSDGGAPHYDGGAGDATLMGESGTDASAPGDDAAAEASEPTDAGTDATESETGTDAGDAALHEDAGTDAKAPEGGLDAEADAPTDSALDAPAETSSNEDAASDASQDAAGSQDSASDGPTIVPPVCDGVIGAGEYGGAGNQAASTSGQTWLMTWDDTNLYIAIENANIGEGDIVYIAVAPGTDAGAASGTTTGELYDSTDVTTLPFGAGLVAYAHDGYTEARQVVAGAWGTPNTTLVLLCDNAGAQVREEVIPWSLLGGRPSAFGWTGYLAANGSTNPNGYIYGQMPTGNPSGAPANADTFTQYYEVPNATPGVDLPFSDVQ